MAICRHSWSCAFVFGRYTAMLRRSTVLNCSCPSKTMHIVVQPILPPRLLLDTTNILLCLCTLHTGIQRLSISDVPRNSAKERRFAERSCGQVHGGVWSSTSTVTVVHTRCATRTTASFSTSLQNERGDSLHGDKTQWCLGHCVLNYIFFVVGRRWLSW